MVRIVIVILVSSPVRVKKTVPLPPEGWGFSLLVGGGNRDTPSAGVADDDREPGRLAAGRR
jgi:hypothetical protein